MSQQPNPTLVERQKARWKPDHLAVNCDRCSKQFGLLTRKHHCRRCYLVFCDACSTARVLLPGYGNEPQRVCEICKAIVQGSTAQMTAATSSNLPQSQNASPSSRSGGSFLGSFANRPTSSQLESSTGGKQNASSSPTQQSQSQQQQVLTAGGVPLPSLECYPRERRVLVIGSQGVGKQSFINTSCGSVGATQQIPGTIPAGAGGGIFSSTGDAATGGTGGASMIGSAAVVGGFGGVGGVTQSSNMNPNTNNSARQNTSAATSAAAATGINSNDYDDGNNNNSNIGASGGGGQHNNNTLTERRRNIPYQGQFYQLVLVNTAGNTVSSELFVHPLLTIGTAAYIMMYDVTEPKSFEVLPMLHERLLDCGAHDKAMILVGSKADHVSQAGAGRDRGVSKDAAVRLAQQWRIPHVDVSCTSKDSVDVALNELLKEISVKDTY